MEKTIDKAIAQVVAGTLDFPGYIRMLEEAGVENYSVDVASHRVFFRSVGRTLIKYFPGDSLEIAKVFDEAGVKAAIGAAQRKEVQYPEFLKLIAAAGIESYDTDIVGRKIIYRGKGRQYIEPFPGTKS